MQTVHTDGMDGLLYLLQKLKKAAAFPAVLTSCAMLVLYALALFPADSSEVFATGTAAALSPLFGTLLCALYVHTTTKSVKTALAAALCFLSANAVLLLSVGVSVSLFGALLMALFFGFVTERTEQTTGFLFCLLPAVLLTFSASLLAENFETIVRNLADAAKGRGAVFGVINLLYRLLIGDGWQGLFYHKAYGVTAVIGNQIVTGAQDVFAAADSTQRSTAQYLCGGYFAAIFIPVGITSALYRRAEPEMKPALLAALALSVLGGDERLFYLLLFLISPLLLVSATFAVFVGYLVSALLDLRVGFTTNAHIFAMFRNLHSGWYFFIAGAILAVLAGLAARYCVLRFGIGTAPVRAPAVQKLVRALGGEENILKVQNGCVVVANPNLIDVLSLDCDICENTVTLTSDDINLLRCVV